MLLADLQRCNHAPCCQKFSHCENKPSLGSLLLASWGVSRLVAKLVLNAQHRRRLTAILLAQLQPSFGCNKKDTVSTDSGQDKDGALHWPGMATLPIMNGLCPIALYRQEGCRQRGVDLSLSTVHV